jgi:hypothetical protein
VYDDVVHVEALDSGDFANLELLERPELGITFTKLHCWQLVSYSKCVFLDADTLVGLVHTSCFNRGIIHRGTFRCLKTATNSSTEKSFLPLPMRDGPTASTPASSSSVPPSKRTR